MEKVYMLAGMGWTVDVKARHVFLDRSTQARVDPDGRCSTYQRELDCALVNFNLSNQSGGFLVSLSSESSAENLTLSRIGDTVMLKVHSRKFGEVVILCLQGRLVKGDTAALREAVESQSHVNAILLDLTRVSTVDAGGLGILLELRAQTLSRGTRFKLMNVTGFVRRVFQISRLDSVFEISSAEEVLPLASNERRLSREHLLACA